MTMSKEAREDFTTEIVDALKGDENGRPNDLLNRLVLAAAAHAAVALLITRAWTDPKFGAALKTVALDPEWRSRLLDLRDLWYKFWSDLAVEEAIARYGPPPVPQRQREPERR